MKGTNARLLFTEEGLQLPSSGGQLCCAVLPDRTTFFKVR